MRDPNSAGPLRRWAAALLEGAAAHLLTWSNNVLLDDWARTRQHHGRGGEPR